MKKRMKKNTDKSTMKKIRKNISVLDTNTLLDGGMKLVKYLSELDHLILIPRIVIRELAKHKNRGGVKGANVRSIIRLIDSLKDQGDELYAREGAFIPALCMRISMFDEGIHPSLVAQSWFDPCEPDHRVLNMAYHLNEYCIQRNLLRHEVTLWTRDIEMRVHARSLRLVAEDLPEHILSDNVNLNDIYTGFRSIELSDPDLVTRFWTGDLKVQSLNSTSNIPFKENEYLFFKNEGAEVGLGVVKEGMVCNVRRYKEVYGITPRNPEQDSAVDALTDPEIPLVFLKGKAGTGKTLLAIAAALSVKKEYHQILVARPVIPLGNKETGFLPGDIDSKLEPYMQPIYDNLRLIMNKLTDKRRTFLEQEISKGGLEKKDKAKKKIIVEPLAYIRGRSLFKTYLIVDEAQNLDPHEIKTIITRAGDDTKVVFTGDPSQIDVPSLRGRRSNGLLYAIDGLAGKKLVAIVGLEKGERSMLADLAANCL